MLTGKSRNSLRRASIGELRRASVGDLPFAFRDRFLDEEFGRGGGGPLAGLRGEAANTTSPTNSRPGSRKGAARKKKVRCPKCLKKVRCGVWLRKIGVRNMQALLQRAIANNDRDSSDDGSEGLSGGTSSSSESSESPSKSSRGGSPRNHSGGGSSPRTESPSSPRSDRRSRKSKMSGPKSPRSSPNKTAHFEPAEEAGVAKRSSTDLLADHAPEPGAEQEASSVPLDGAPLGTITQSENFFAVSAVEISPESLKKLREARLAFEQERQRVVTQSLAEIREVAAELARCRRSEILELMTELSERVTAALGVVVPLVKAPQAGEGEVEVAAPVGGSEEEILAEDPSEKEKPRGRSSAFARGPGLPQPAHAGGAPRPPPPIDTSFASVSLADFAAGGVVPPPTNMTESDVLPVLSPAALHLQKVLMVIGRRLLVAQEEWDKNKGVSVFGSNPRGSSRGRMSGK